jgi:hypothetical protein
MSNYLVNIQRSLMKNAEKDLSDVLLSIDHQMARLEEQRQDLEHTRSRAKRAGV